MGILKIYVFLVLALTSCSIFKKNSEIIEPKYRTDYYYQENKNIFYRNCLKYGFNNDSCINQILDQDCGYMQDLFLNLSHYDEIKKLAMETSLMIKKDSINEMKRAEGAAGRKIVINTCLNHFLYDGKLDSLAKNCQKSLENINMKENRNSKLQRR